MVKENKTVTNEGMFVLPFFIYYLYLHITYIVFYVYLYNYILPVFYYLCECELPGSFLTLETTIDSYFM